MIVIIIAQPIPGDGGMLVMRKMEIQVEEQDSEKQARLHEYGSFGNANPGAMLVE